MLKLVRDFFIDCQTRAVRYSIWKSLENLEAQLSGEGDIDVVFDPQQRSEVSALLAEHAFILDANSSATVGKDVLVHRGFDRSSGTFVSLHVHFNCRFGSKTHKECRYIYEQEMFRDFVPYEEIQRLCDGHFFTIRLLSVAMRETPDDPFIEEIACRYEEGIAARDRAILDERIPTYFDCTPAVLFQDIRARGVVALHDRQSIVAAALDEGEARSDYARHAEATKPPRSLRSRLMKVLGRSRNKLNRPAQIVVAGVDGAGKTTVCRLLRRKFSAIGPAYVIYLGRREWSAVNHWVNRRRVGAGPLAWLMRQVWPLSSTAELLLRAANGWARKWLLGAFVIYDRALYDIVMKFSGGYGPAGRVARIVVNFAAARHGDFHYMLEVPVEIAQSRKPAGKYTIPYLRDTQARLSTLLPDRYVRLDSGASDADEIANQIVGRYFEAAVTWPRRY